MSDTFTLSLSKTYTSTPHELFSRIEDGTLFDLTGADEITFYFKEDGAFSLLFIDRGEIFGTIKKIIPNEKVEMIWNVTGFDKPEERNTELVLSMELTEENKTWFSVLNTGIKHKDAFEAKERAWKEILEDLQKELLPNTNNTK